MAHFLHFCQLKLRNSDIVLRVTSASDTFPLQQQVVYVISNASKMFAKSKGVCIPSNAHLASSLKYAKGL